MESTGWDEGKTFHRTAPTHSSSRVLPYESLTPSLEIEKPLTRCHRHKSLIHSKPCSIVQGHVFLYPWKIFFFSTGLCPFQGPTPPRYMKGFKNSLTLEISLIYLLSQRWKEKNFPKTWTFPGHKSTLWTTWLPKFTAGDLRMRYYVEETAVVTSSCPGFFRMRKRARKNI